MPNAAKLLGALALAVLAFVLSGMVMGLFEEDTNFGYFTHINVALGIAIGWTFLGRRVGRGWVSAINVGFTGAVVLVFWGLFVQACYEMFDDSMKGRIDDMGEAVTTVFEAFVEWAVLMSTGPIWGTIVVGGVLAGLLTEFAWRNYQ